MDWLVIPVIALGICAWFALTDLATAFAPATAAGMLPRRQLVACTLAAIIAGGLLWGQAPTYALAAKLQFPSWYVIAIVTASAMIASYATRRLGRHHSPVYGLLGATAAWMVVSRHGAGLADAAQWPLSWIAAMAAAGLLAAALLKVYKLCMTASDIHLLTLSGRLRWALAVAIVLLGLAIGINNGSLVMALFSESGHDVLLSFNSLKINGQQAVWVLLPVVAFFAVRRFLFRRTEAMADHDFDTNVPALIASLTATGVVMLLFSFEGAASTVGLAPSPLPAGHLVLISVAATSLVQCRQAIDAQALKKGFISLLFTTILAFGVAYALFSFGLDKLSPGAPWGMPAIDTPQQYNITVPMMVVLLGAAVCTTVMVMRKHQKTKAQARLQASRQQQQLFEQQQDLTALEIKQALIENESLNHRLEQRRGELINIALSIGEQKEFLEGVLRSLKATRAEKDREQKEALLAELENTVLQRMSFSQEAESLYAQAEALHRDFSLRLAEKYPRLTVQERKMTTLLRLGFSTKYIAALMNISPKSVDIGRYRLRAKFGLERDRKLTEFIKTI